MDQFDYTCPECGVAGQAPGKLLGKGLQCEACGKGFFASGIVKPRSGSGVWIAFAFASVVVGITSALAGAAVASVAAADAEQALTHEVAHQDEQILDLQRALAETQTKALEAELALEKCTCRNTGD